uniref:KIB1-4 beta-propeller domain-containing protein n=2 Tax=Aegilops tauschii TaxID=37682 RepID=N1R1P1_AEGTA
MEIVRFEVGLTKHGVFKSNPQWLFVGGLRSMVLFYQQNGGDPDEQAVYIVELHGKIVIAIRRMEWSRPRNTYVSFFSVFELAEVYGYMSKWNTWKHLKSLGDHALFLGSTFSKAMQMSADENGYLQRNNIYYSHHRCYPQKESVPGDAEEFFTASNSNGRHVYYKTHYKEDESNVGGITTVGHYVMGADKYPPVWLFPSDL